MIAHFEQETQIGFLATISIDLIFIFILVAGLGVLVLSDVWVSLSLSSHAIYVQSANDEKQDNHEFLDDLDLQWHSCVGSSSTLCCDSFITDRVCSMCAIVGGGRTENTFVVW